MSRSVALSNRSQLALQSYLDGLLQEATEEELPSVSAEEFEAAVAQERLRDVAPPAPAPAPAAAPAPIAVLAPVTFAEAPVVLPSIAPVVPLPVLRTEPEVPPVVPEVEAPVEPEVPAQLEADLGAAPPPKRFDEHPAWAQEPFECLLFDVAGLMLAVPLVSLGSIYPLDGEELTPLFGQPDWFLGILPNSQAGNLKVLDTARWVMPERYREDLRDGLQYVISVQGFDWGLAVHQVSRSIRLDPREVKWRGQRGQRPWLAGTVIEHMCALLDVAALAELVVSGGKGRSSH